MTYPRIIIIIIIIIIINNSMATKRVLVRTTCPEITACTNKPKRRVYTEPLITDRKLDSENNAVKLHSTLRNAIFTRERARISWSNIANRAGPLYLHGVCLPTWATDHQQIFFLSFFLEK